MKIQSQRKIKNTKVVVEEDKKPEELPVYARFG